MNYMIDKNDTKLIYDIKIYRVLTIDNKVVFNKHIYFCNGVIINDFKIIEWAILSGLSNDWIKINRIPVTKDYKFSENNDKEYITSYGQKMLLDYLKKEHKKRTLMSFMNNLRYWVVSRHKRLTLTFIAVVAFLPIIIGTIRPFYGVMLEFCLIIFIIMCSDY